MGGPTDAISKAVFDTSKIPCAYSFKYGKIFPEGRFLNILGHCSYCGSTLEGHCMERPLAGEGISINITTTDTRGIPHNAKRAVKDRARESMGSELLIKKPRQFRHEAMEN